MRASRRAVGRYGHCALDGSPVSKAVRVYDPLITKTVPAQRRRPWLPPQHSAGRSSMDEGASVRAKSSGQK